MDRGDKWTEVTSGQRFIFKDRYTWGIKGVRFISAAFGTIVISTVFSTCPLN